ncbi:kinesin-like protein KIF20A [Anneissia japonica]|uniref:kinesin-like protein KIF20A n=1 Tax=Anneissia japonica TaxID=1529436 RepID=UPI0014259610|nr:kinesin-like protein KIF20A [Anneissia japonica]
MATLKYDLSDDDVEISTGSIACKDLFENLLTPMKMTRQSVAHSSEPIKVYLRIRPFTGTEVEDGESQNCMEVVDNSFLLTHAPHESFNFKNITRVGGALTHKYTFSNIFHEDTSQKRFFDEMMLGTVKDFVDGQNSLVFTYGVTNAGKTHTIQGNAQDGGILPRSLDVIFNSTKGRLYPGMQMKPKLFADVIMLNETQLKAEEDKKAAVLRLAVPNIGDDSNVSESDSSRLSENSIAEDSTFSIALDETKDGESVSNILNDINLRITDNTSVEIESQGPVKFSIWISFVEIYNEYIYDLLEPMPKGKKARRPTLKLAEDKNGNVYIKGLTEVMVTSSDEAYKMLKIGQKNLSFASTKLNYRSSRSHCMFRIKVLRVVDMAEPHVARVSMLSFCDLAGSERSTRTPSVGDRMKEAANINNSLLTLRKCIKVLRYNQHHQQKGQKVIPFRESKLTRLFQSFFMGHGKASMIVNVNQCASVFDETMHVLKFSAIAKQVTTVTSELEKKLEEVINPKIAAARVLSNNQAAKTPQASRQSIAWTEMPDKSGSENTIIEEDEEENSYKKELLSLIELLKQRLVEERQKQILMESKIREEVCNEMAQQLNIGSEDSMINKQMYVMQEEKCKRIEMYMQSVKKNCKRAGIENDDDKWVSSKLLHAEKMKVKERDERIEILNNMVSSLQEKAKLSKELVAGDAKSTDESTEVLKKQVSEMRQTILKQQSEVTELQQTLHDEFHAKKEEIQRLKEKITEDSETMDGQKQALEDLQQAHQERNKMLEAANVKLQDRDRTIENMQQEVLQLKQSHKTDNSVLLPKGDETCVLEVNEIMVENKCLEKKQKQMTELVKKIRRIENEKLHLAEELEQVKELNGKLTKTELKSEEYQRKQVGELKEKLKKMQSDSDHIHYLYIEKEKIVKLNVEIKEMGEEKLRKAQEINEKVMKSKEEIKLQVEELQKKIKEVKEVKEQEVNLLIEKMRKVREQKEDIEGVMVEKENQLQESLKKVREVTVEKEINDRLFADKEMELEEKVRKLKEINEKGHVEICKKISNLIKGKQKMKEKLNEKETEVESLNEKITMLNEENAKYEEESNELQKLTEEKERLKKLLMDKDRQACEIHGKFENLDKENQRLQELLAEKCKDVSELKETIKKQSECKRLKLECVRGLLNEKKNEPEAFRLKKNTMNDDTSRIEISVTPLQKKKTWKRQGRKRKAIVNSDENGFQSKTSKKQQPPRPQRRTRATKTEEEMENKPAVIEPSHSPGSESICRRNRKQAALTNLGDMFHNKANKIADAASSITTPQKSPPRIVEIYQPGTEKKKKRKLYTYISTPFECNPHEVIYHTKVADSSHGIVTKKLKDLCSQRSK